MLHVKFFSSQTAILTVEFESSTWPSFCKFIGYSTCYTSAMNPFTTSKAKNWWQPFTVLTTTDTRVLFSNVFFLILSYHGYLETDEKYLKTLNINILNTKWQLTTVAGWQYTISKRRWSINILVIGVTIYIYMHKKQRKWQKKQQQLKTQRSIFTALIHFDSIILWTQLRDKTMQIQYFIFILMCYLGLNFEPFKQSDT